MSMYTTQNEFEVLTRAILTIPGFKDELTMCARRYQSYERARVKACEYLNAHASGRPTNKREHLQVVCSSRFGEFWGTLHALHTIARVRGYSRGDHSRRDSRAAKVKEYMTRWRPCTLV